MKTFLAIILCIFIWNWASAQNDESFSLLGFSVGTGFTDSYYKTISTNDFVLLFPSELLSNIQTNPEFIPTYSFSYDHQFNDRFSFGGIYTFQKLEKEYELSTYLFSGSNESGFLKLTQQNISVRGLFHYHRYHRLGFYSGIRLGVNFNEIEAHSNNTDWTDKIMKRNGAQFALQLVAFGTRFKIMKDLFANAEICFGSPYLINIGVMGVF